MILIKFYVEVLSDDFVSLQIVREDDIQKNVYKKVVRCKLDDILDHVHSLEGDWRLILQKAL